jgi:hypothetical protein
VNYQRIKEQNIIENIDEIIKAQPEIYIIENNYFMYKYDPRIEKMMINYITWIQEETNNEEKKMLFELIFGIHYVYNSERVTLILSKYYAPIFNFFMELDLNVAINTPEFIHRALHFLPIL